MLWNGKCRKPTWPTANLGSNTDINTLLFQAVLLSAISEIDTPAVRVVFMLCWFIGRQLSASVAWTGIASIFSCITSCSVVITACSQVGSLHALQGLHQSQRQIGAQITSGSCFSFYFFKFLRCSCRSVSTFSIGWSNDLKRLH